MAFNYGYPCNFASANPFPMNPPMPQQAPQTQPVPVQGLSPSSRMVSNREEANSVPADFSGALMVFPDVNHNRIYIKRWNTQMGAAEFLEFIPAMPETISIPAGSQYATKEEIEVLRAEIEALKKPAGKAGKRNDSDE